MTRGRAHRAGGLAAWLVAAVRTAGLSRQPLWVTACWVSGLHLGLLAVLLFVPLPDVMRENTPPAGIVMLCENISPPAPSAVRSLQDVRRQTFEPQEEAPEQPRELTTPMPTPAPTEIPLEAQPLLSSTPLTPVAAPATLAGSARGLEKLQPVTLLANTPEQVEVQRAAAPLQTRTAARRLVAAAEQPTATAQLQQVPDDMARQGEDQGLREVAARLTAVTAATAGLQEPTRGTSLSGADRAATLLANLKPSPIRFESFQGLQVPVARLADQLAQLDAAGSGGKGVNIDGVVQVEESSKSWKSGRFHLHAPGGSPPEADPATYCYVSKTESQGKPCLYVAFVCQDPDLKQLLTRSDGGSAAALIMDDSIEIFLDTNCDRKDYNQLIVNAKGAYWAAYMATPQAVKNPQAWDAQLSVKTALNKETGQWSCEILIPFDRLGGVPPAGSRWAVNFCRNFRGQKDDKQLQSWFAVYDKNRNFHHPDRFGIFQW